mgnify:CR=1 FL=1
MRHNVASLRSTPGPAVGTDTVDLSLRVLEYLAGAAQPIGVSEIAREFDASKATIYRHLQTLVHHGFVRQDAATMRYHAGIKLFILGERLRERFDILHIARDELMRLRDLTAQAVTLSALVDEQVVVLEVIQAPAIVNFGTQPGTVLDLHASAHGKVALAFGPGELLSRCLARPLRQWTAQTITSHAALARAVAQIRARGWTTAANQVLPGINGLAAPLFDHAGRYAGAIAVAGTVQAIPSAPPAGLIEAVTRTAAQISRNLGFTAKWPRTSNGT